MNILHVTTPIMYIQVMTTCTYKLLLLLVEKCSHHHKKTFRQVSEKAYLDRGTLIREWRIEESGDDVHYSDGDILLQCLVCVFPVVSRVAHLYLKTGCILNDGCIKWNLGIRDTQGTVKNCPQF